MTKLLFFKFIFALIFMIENQDKKRSKIEKRWNSWNRGRLMAIGPSVGIRTQNFIIHSLQLSSSRALKKKNRGAEKEI